jgi:anthranilate synthase component 2
LRRVLLLDNYDSFTYNLHHILEMQGCEVDVVRNDELDIDGTLECDFIVLSPGPGLPQKAGCMMSLIDKYTGKIPILGVCLGMQGIAIHLGGSIYNQETVKHGLQEEIEVLRSTLFPDSGRREVGLYHSWAVEDVAADFSVTARNSSGVVMAIENPTKKLYGVQFHPESIMTPNGKEMVRNFLES